jgi:hypothetical protein
MDNDIEVAGNPTLPNILPLFKSMFWEAELLVENGADLFVTLVKLGGKPAPPKTPPVLAEKGLEFTIGEFEL